MAVSKDKYERLEIRLERSEYRRLFAFIQERGWTFAYFVRIAIAEGIDATLHKERQGLNWSDRRKA